VTAENTKWYEAAFGPFYPVLYSRRDEGEAERVLESFGDLLRPDGRILDLACGSGRYMIAAARRGLRVWGVDLSGFLLSEAADRKELAGNVVRADMRRLPFPGRTFEAVLSMFTSFGYFSVDMDNLLVLREVSRVLTNGGTFLLDFLNAGRLNGMAPEETERESNGYLISEHRSLEAEGKFLVKHVRAASRKTGAMLEYDERIRLYTRGELLVMLDSVDLGVSGLFGDYDRGEYDETNSERIIMVCEKQASVLDGAQTPGAG
jgi:SAM-dependent methyltransferase